jgi:hypothetical protein
VSAVHGRSSATNGKDGTISIVFGQLNGTNLAASAQVVRLEEVDTTTTRATPEKL